VEEPILNRVGGAENAIALLLRCRAAFARSVFSPTMAAARLTPLERARAFIDNLRAGANYDHTALDGLSVESADAGRVVCRLRATRSHANRYGTMHGGCIGVRIGVTCGCGGGLDLAVCLRVLSC